MRVGVLVTMEKMEKLSSTNRRIRGGVQALAMVVSLFFVVIGCSERASEPIGTVKGSVRLKGKAVAAGYFVTIISDSGVGASGQTDSSGNFVLAAQDSRGVPVGKYKASVKPPSSATGPIDHDAATNQHEIGKAPSNPFGDFPTKYMNSETSGLSLEVKVGEQSFDIDLKP